MRLLSRYLLRQLAAPFIYSLATLTSFMLLNQVAKRFGALVGKGLSWSVIAEVFALSVPFIAAMTLPMAVLVAVLYTFSHLAADNEITAMRASGIGLLRIVRPVLLWGIVMAAANFVFLDQALPRTNARLRNLLVDIGRKKPTLELQEQVINDIPPSPYFLRVGRIDAGTGRLRGVTIFDLGAPESRRVIYADSGLMAYSAGGADLSLRLFHGKVHEYRPGDPGVFQLTYFAVNEIRIKDVFNQLQRNSMELPRGDREMTTCEMQAVVDTAAWQYRTAEQEETRLTLRDLHTLLGLPAPPPAAPGEPPRPGGYCRWWVAFGSSFLPETAHAETPAQAIGRPVVTGPAAAAPARSPAPRQVSLTSWATVAGTHDRMHAAQSQIDRFDVEIHKKWAIAAASIAFVLIGIALALRFPRGGMGLVIGGALAIFAVYYVGLTAGEGLADRGLVGPAVAMWSPDIIIVILGVLGLIRVNRESGSTRGGDLQELGDTLRRWGRRLTGGSAR